MKTIYTSIFFLLLASQFALNAQHSLVLPMSSPISQVNSLLESKPDLKKESASEEVIYGNDLFEARYNFQHGLLNKTFLEHRFKKEEMADLELMGYIGRFQKDGVTILPLFRGNKVKIFYAYHEDTHIEIIYRKFSRKDYSIQVKLYEGEPSDVQLLTQNTAQ